MVEGTDTKTKLWHQLILYAASAALSCLVIFGGFRLLDANNAEATKKSLQHRKQLSKRLNRPLIHTTQYEVTLSIYNPNHNQSLSFLP